MFKKVLKYFKKLFGVTKSVDWRTASGKLYLREREDSNGKPHGKKEEWNKDGIKIFEATYKHGKLHGKVIYYDDLGNPLLECLYKNNKLLKHDA